MAACGGTAVEDTTTTVEPEETTTSDMMTTTTDDPTTTSEVTPPDETPVGEFTDEPFTSDGFPGSGTTAFLIHVGFTPQEGFDRVVFEFHDSVDEFTYEINPVEAPILEDPSGQEIDVEGDAFYEITMTPASTVDLSGDEPQEIYTGPDRVPSLDDAFVVTEIVLTGDFENVMTWVVGLESEAGYAHALQMDENQLVVEFQP
ncbi:MAG: hypothetical protein DWQ40_08815 [Actinobacteria bacterium]|nr:MAG: hypothetical protein DWQ40_08815 [Actinomycetota bacterium]